MASNSNQRKQALLLYIYISPSSDTSLHEFHLLESVEYCPLLRPASWLERNIERFVCGSVANETRVHQVLKPDEEQIYNRTDEDRRMNSRDAGGTTPYSNHR